MEMIVKNFEQWTDEDVQFELGYRQIDKENFEPLINWLKTEEQIPLSESSKKLQKLLENNVNDWNEDELKFMFIAPILNEVDFNNYPHYKVFSQRKVTLKTDKIDAQGKIEWFVAKGKKKPKNPFFFLHEYKKELGGTNDPLGQLLVAMIYAQQQNEENLPVYGSYVVGRLWFFVALKDQEYAVSSAFDASKEDDLQFILAHLYKVKQHIQQLTHTV